MINSNIIIKLSYIVGYGLIGYSIFNLYKIFDTSLIITKRKFKQIESNIRQDERRNMEKMMQEYTSIDKRCNEDETNR